MPQVKVKTAFNGVNDGEVYPKVFKEGVHTMGKDLAAIAVKEGWGEIVDDTTPAAPAVPTPTPDAGGDDAPPANPYSKEELEKLSHKELVEMATSLGVEKAQQTKKVDLVQAIIALTPATPDAGEGEGAEGGEGGESAGE